MLTKIVIGKSITIQLIPENEDEQKALGSVNQVNYVPGFQHFSNGADGYDSFVITTNESPEIQAIHEQMKNLIKDPEI